VSSCFVDQVANQDILSRVTSHCSLCYDELKVGDMIYYDMQEYRYLCKKCHEELCESMDNNCEVVDDNGGLFD